MCVGKRARRMLATTAEKRISANVCWQRARRMLATTAGKRISVEAAVSFFFLGRSCFLLSGCHLKLLVFVCFS
jgi:hypothetical protein